MRNQASDHLCLALKCSTTKPQGTCWLTLLHSYVTGYQIYDKFSSCHSCNVLRLNIIIHSVVLQSEDLLHYCEQHHRWRC